MQNAIRAYRREVPKMMMGARVERGLNSNSMYATPASKGDSIFTLPTEVVNRMTEDHSGEI